MKQPISLTFVNSIYRTASSARTPWHKTRSSDLREIFPAVKNAAKNQFQLEDSQKFCDMEPISMPYKSAIAKDLCFTVLHRQKKAWHFFFIVGNCHPMCFFGAEATLWNDDFRARPNRWSQFALSWVSGKVSNALEMRGASCDARNTRSGLLAYIHTPRVWFVDIWPMVQDSPSRGHHISQIPHPGCPGLISSKSNASLSFDSISTAWDSTFWDWDWLLGWESLPWLQHIVGALPHVPLPAQKYMQEKHSQPI